MMGLYRIPDRTVGIVYRRYGRNLAGDSRVSVDDSMGWQAAVLQPNTRHRLNPVLFEVKYVPQVVVPDGTIGVVEAKGGRVRPSGRRLGQYVECDHFRDAEAFLRNGGEQGRQMMVLPGGGRYSINTELFSVTTIHTVGPRTDGLAAADLHEVRIPEGHIGVVIALDGRPPSDDPDAVGRLVEGHSDFRAPWVFLGRGGQRGVQQQILDGGSSYAINPWFARVVQIPTRDLHLEWTSKSQEDAGNYDSALDKIVVDIQGHRLSLEMSQVLRIPAKAAPRLVRRFGEGELNVDAPVGGAAGARQSPVQRFVERVLGAAVAGYFTEIVARYQVLDFIRDYNEVRLQLQDKVTHALKEWDVVAGRTVLGEFVSEDRELNDLRRQLAQQHIDYKKEERRQEFLEQQRINEEIAAEIERIAIELQGERDVVVLRKQIEAIGRSNWLTDRMMAHMAKMAVPQYVSGGSTDIADRLLGLMPFINAQDVLKAVVQGQGRDDTPGDHPDRQSIVGPDGERAGPALSGGVPADDPAPGAAP